MIARRVLCMSGKVVPPNKTSCGLRQSPRVFNKLLMQKLLKLGLERCDAPVYFPPMTPGMKMSLIVGVYAEDLIVTGGVDVCKSARISEDELVSNE